MFHNVLEVLSVQNYDARRRDITTAVSLSHLSRRGTKLRECSLTALKGEALCRFRVPLLRVVCACLSRWLCVECRQEGNAIIVFLFFGVSEILACVDGPVGFDVTKVDDIFLKIRGRSERNPTVPPNEKKKIQMLSLCKSMIVSMLLLHRTPHTLHTYTRHTAAHTGRGSWCCSSSCTYYERSARYTLLHSTRNLASRNSRFPWK